MCSGLAAAGVKAIRCAVLFSDCCSLASQIAKLTPREEVSRAVARVCVDALNYLAPGEAKPGRDSSATADTRSKSEDVQPVIL